MHRSIPKTKAFWIVLTIVSILVIIKLGNYTSSINDETPQEEEKATDPCQRSVSPLADQREPKNRINFVVSQMATEPPFCMTTIPKTPANSEFNAILAQDTKFIGYAETKLFHHILYGRCSQDGKSALVVDVGANYGYYTMFPAVMGCRVITFEPQPFLGTYFNISARLNGVENKITFYNRPVGTSNDIVKFPVSETISGFLGLNAKPGKGIDYWIDVPMIRLDQAVHENVKLLKIDVEGTELQVLSGMNWKLDVENIIVEFKQLNWRPESEQFLRQKVKEGYKAYHYEEVYFISDQEAKMYDWDLNTVNIVEWNGVEPIPRFGEDWWLTKNPSLYPTLRPKAPKT